MRKRPIAPATESARNRGEIWLDVERAAVVEVTSEDADYPIELALVSEGSRGWRAAAAGTLKQSDWSSNWNLLLWKSLYNRP
jgi:hypothetical protein